MDVEIELVSNCRAIDLFQQNLTNAFVKPYRQKSSIDQAGLTVPYRNTVSKTIQKQVFPTTTLFACAGPQGPTHTGCNNQNYDFVSAHFVAYDFK